METNLANIIYKRASVNNNETILEIIKRCMIEINYVDYSEKQLTDYMEGFSNNWLTGLIKNTHYYESWYNGEIVAVGGVNRDLSQQNQSYLTSIFVKPDFRGQGVGCSLVKFLENDEWCLDSNLIEVPSSKSSHGFYYKLGYEYRTNPPLFKDEDGSTIMYKYT